LYQKFAKKLKSAKWYLLFVVRTNGLDEFAPLGGVAGDADSRSSQTDDDTGVNDGVRGVNSDQDELVERDDADDIFRDSSVMEDDANSAAHRRRFDKTVDF
jgi:hypothetical protein